MFFRFLEETKEAELEYSMELTDELEEPSKKLIQNTFIKNIINMTKNEKCYYITRMTELFLVSVIVIINVVPVETFSFLKLPSVFLNVKIWTVLFCLCILLCIAVDNLFQFRDKWQNEKELVNALKNECLKYRYKLGVYGQKLDIEDRKALFLQRFLELTGESYALFEYQEKQEKKEEQSQNIKNEKIPE